MPSLQPPRHISTLPTFRSLFGEVPVRVRRRLACPCRGACEAKSSTVLDLGKGALAPELAYVTARYAALAPFGKVAALLVRAAVARRGAARQHGTQPAQGGGAPLRGDRGQGDPS